MKLRTFIAYQTFLIVFNYAYGQKSTPASDCPSINEGDNFTQSEFLSRLADECRYDRLLLPTYATGETVYVHASAYVYFIQPAEAHDLNFKLHFLLQLRWTDLRLAYHLYSPKRVTIIGEDDLRRRIWVPHLYMSNEQSSSLMGTDSKDVLISISPSGEVVFSRRMQAVLYCWMNLQKFPFDDQTCSMNLESWKYNASILRLMWEKGIPPVHLSPELHLTEYSLIDFWTNESVVRGDISSMRLIGVGNYSALKFTFKLGREVGYYLMDYFIPSMMIVAMSWVTFWLQADASAPRITLGTSTMLSFITLASSQAKTLPKVSYIKASEIWFLGCIGFIFSALVEFAFVNTIWRRKKVVSLKKVNSKYILKSTLTPRLARKELQKELQESSPQLSKSRSCSSLNQDTSTDPAGPGYNNYLTVHSFPSALNLPTITTQSYDDLMPGQGGPNRQQNGADSDGSDEPPKHHTWTTMTPQEIATWIDKRSRIMFPILFVFFNIIYWTFVYCL
ncbi:pH-sensitive chloride channel 2-like isoform X2 [Galleria mellonella]|uniref:PH-sensitive chloride channel 2-like isoform X2 n=1 Tax=Galleria mellonella TaxID=7137 RepID=A0A6J3BXX1_GALME|nr:pH-sensitive chloride channel 2-like isoform X2 [Galleria mellonella]